MLFNVKRARFQTRTSIFVHFMQGGKEIYTQLHKLSSLLLIMALAWLTVCLPYISEGKQGAGVQIESTADSGAEDCENPLSNTNEEKTPSGTSLLSEYLQDTQMAEHSFITLTSFYKCHPSDLYLAYHPDLIIPPPEA